MEVGDTFYVLSYRWWESWKYFISTKSKNQQETLRASNLEEDEEDLDDVIEDYLYRVNSFNLHNVNINRKTSLKPKGLRK